MKALLFFVALLTTMTAMAAHHAGMLTNKQGMTLYTFDNDTKGKSNCYGNCAVSWPPYLAGSEAKAEGHWGLTERKDGSKQWTYNGQPLYTWVGDTKAGDTTGDGVGGVWHIAKKSHKKAKKTSKSSYDY